MFESRKQLRCRLRETERRLSEQKQLYRIALGTRIRMRDIPGSLTCVTVEVSMVDLCSAPRSVKIDLIATLCDGLMKKAGWIGGFGS